MITINHYAADMFLLGKAFISEKIPLTEMQQTCFDYVSQGLTRKEIAKAMDKTDAGIRDKIEEIRKKGWL